MRVIQLAKELVAFESPSHVSNSEISQFIADRLQSLGFELELVEYTDALGLRKVNVLGRLAPQQPTQAKGVAYFCHSDVVPAEDWSGPGEAYQATERDGRLYGRGSCDMKGSTAAMLCAIEQWHGARPHAPLYFVCTADEELSYAGAKQLVAKSEMYREMVEHQPRVLIGEPTELKVIHAHKGICKLVITSHGESAHSSSRQGLNANLAMIPFLQELKAVYEETEREEQWQNKEFDPPTMSLNIGINDHTAAINVKPAQSVCTVFYRPLPSVDDQPLIERIRASAAKFGLDFVLHSRCDAVYTAPDRPVVREALDLTEHQAAGTVSYGTDAGELTELRDKIVCGPGSIAQAHTADEWIDLRQLQQGVDMYQRLLRHWCL